MLCRFALLFSSIFICHSGFAACPLSTEELFKSAAFGNSQDLKSFLDQGCSSQSLNSDGDTMAVIARRSSNLENLKLLCSLGENSKICTGFSENLNTDLQKAVFNRDHQEIKRLLTSSRLAPIGARSAT